MSEPGGSKSAGAWKWIMMGGAAGLVLVGAVVYGLLALAVAKGKPQIAQALGKVIEAQSGNLPPEKLILLKHMSVLASMKDSSLAAVWMISQSVSGALADGKVSEEEVRLLERVSQFVSTPGGRVGFKEAGVFMNSDAGLKKLLEEEGLPQGTAKKDEAPTTGTPR